MLLNKFISIDIGTKSTKLVEGKFNKNKVIVNKAIQLETPRNSVDNGSISNKALLHSQLLNSIKTNSFQAKSVNCTIKSSNIINREIEIPKADPAELDTLIKYEIQQYLPIRIEDYVLQYNVIEEFSSETDEGIKDKLRVMVTALPAHIAKAYYELLKDLNLKPNALDVNFNSVRKLLKNRIKVNEEFYNIDDSIAIIDFGAESIEVDIIAKGKIDFTRMIMSGGNDINKRISEGQMVPIEEAEKLKVKKLDLMIMPDEIAIDNNEVTYYAKETIDEWIQEISKILQYYRNKKIGNRIEKVYIHGGGSRIKGLSSYIEKMIGIKVIGINQISSIEFGKDVDTKDTDLFINAIGAIIRL